MGARSKAQKLKGQGLWWRRWRSVCGGACVCMWVGGCEGRYGPPLALLRARVAPVQCARDEHDRRTVAVLAVSRRTAHTCTALRATQTGATCAGWAWTTRTWTARHAPARPPPTRCMATTRIGRSTRGAARCFSAQSVCKAPALCAVAQARVCIHLCTRRGAGGVPEPAHAKPPPPPLVCV